VKTDMQHDVSKFNPTEDRIADYRQALGNFPTGVTIITCMSQSGPLGITVNSFTSVSLKPPLIMWCLNKKSTRFSSFMDAENFAVHVMPASSKNLCVSFAQSARAFEHTDWSLSVQKVPLLKGSLACFECRQFADYDGGDHSILLGLVDLVSTSSGVPLTFAQGRFIDPDLEPNNNIS